MDLIDMSHRIPKDEELPRLWNIAFDGLVELQKRLEFLARTAAERELRRNDHGQ
jgi:hypothetical protein